MSKSKKVIGIKLNQMGPINMIPTIIEVQIMNFLTIFLVFGTSSLPLWSWNSYLINVWMISPIFKCRWAELSGRGHNKM